MASFIHTTSDITTPAFGQVWRTEDGTLYGDVHLGGAVLVFGTPAEARATAAAITECAAAMDAFPPPGAEMIP